jgi:hypothetical protein
MQWSIQFRVTVLRVEYSTLRTQSTMNYARITLIMVGALRSMDTPNFLPVHCTVIALYTESTFSRVTIFVAEMSRYTCVSSSDGWIGSGS